MVFYYCFACKERSRLFDLFKAFDKIEGSYKSVFSLNRPVRHSLLIAFVEILQELSSWNKTTQFLIMSMQKLPLNHRKQSFIKIKEYLEINRIFS